MKGLIGRLLRRGPRKSFSLFLALSFSIVAMGCNSPMLSPDEVHWTGGNKASEAFFSHPSDYGGQRTILGGVILGVEAFPGRATLRVLAYPLDRDYYPDTRKKPLGPAVVLWSGPPLSTLFVRGNRLTIAGTVVSSEDSRTLRVQATTLSPDTCLSSGGFVCHRNFFGCSCRND